VPVLAVSVQDAQHPAVLEPAQVLLDDEVVLVLLLRIRDVADAGAHVDGLYHVDGGRGGVLVEGRGLAGLLFGGERGCFRVFAQDLGAGVDHGGHGRFVGGLCGLGLLVQLGGGLAAFTESPLVLANYVVL